MKHIAISIQVWHLSMQGILPLIMGLQTTRLNPQLAVTELKELVAFGVEEANYWLAICFALGFSPSGSRDHAAVLSITKGKRYWLALFALRLIQPTPKSTPADEIMIKALKQLLPSPLIDDRVDDSNNNNNNNQTKHEKVFTPRQIFELYALGFLLTHRKKTNEEIITGMNYLAHASELGNVFAQDRVAAACTGYIWITPQNATNRKKGEKLARYLLELASGQGYGRASHRLACLIAKLHQKPSGGIDDSGKQEVIAILTRAIEQGYPQAQAQLTALKR